MKGKSGSNKTLSGSKRVALSAAYTQGTDTLWARVILLNLGNRKNDNEDERWYNYRHNQRHQNGKPLDFSQRFQHVGALEIGFLDPPYSFLRHG